MRSTFSSATPSSSSSSSASFPSLPLRASTVVGHRGRSSSSLLSTPRLKALLNPRRKISIKCQSDTSGPPGSGDSDSKAVLDAFFLGKAFAEALNERIESTVGEFLSVAGQWQAERRTEVIEFQEEVAERAKRAKEKAATEAMESQGLTVRPVAPSDTNVSTQMTSPPIEDDDPLQDMLKD